MTRTSFIFLYAMFLFFRPPVLYAEPVQVHDDLGRLVSLAKPAQRIVTLAPHAVELLFAAGAGDRIVATVSYSDYPASAKKIPRVGSYTAIDVERVLALHPDLVIAWDSGNRKNEIQKLIQLGLTVFINEPHSIADVANSIERLGKLAATEKVADRFVKRFRRHYHRLQKTYQNRRKIRMFYQIWNAPLMTINGQHLISAVMRLCGAENIFKDMPSLSASVSLEAVIAAKPEIIIVGGNKNKNAAWLTAWQAWTTLPAVRHDQLYFINPDLLHRQGPRILDGADIMCRDVEQARAR
ncbi:Vitamin B12 ABC transporter, substrate-binding protein BtuF [hydrothermal vent metagenome]|uniref:Vitamin B12 ABC transporter, substrate-binding protein BtuF n=1 Tax=hydrothermal vent metagenome TaxID=652676 RepID=A0A3B1BQE2_9ZZZZ